MNVDKIRFYHTPKETVTISLQKYWVNYLYTYVAYNPRTLLTKIGRSANYLNRLQKLENEVGPLMLIKVFKGNREKELHLKYSDYTADSGREWFNLTKSQLYHISIMK